ncbi:MAG TPA: ATP synthase F1 subunit delta [Anaeromyxobacteraceae bacterium]|nr:ATP synthase F1 subunit delta [Anaeromyxobacteraceae bacterium]
MIVGSIARRYAKALFSLADEKGQVEQWSKALDVLRHLVALSPLKEALANPALEAEARRSIAKGLAVAVELASPKLLAAAVLGLEEDVRNLLLLLAERNRLAYLPAILDDYRALADQKLGRVRARVTSAVPLAEDEVKRIADKLAQATKAQVIVETSVDPAILGGVVAQVGSTVYDGSVRAQLDELRRSMKQ